MWADPNHPSLADYSLFVYGVAGVDPAYLPTDSPFLGYAYQRAINTVINIKAGLSGLEYTLAVYNCAFHTQLKITPDQVVDGVARTYFAGKREEFQLLQVSSGLVSASSDEGTSVTNSVPDALAQLTLTDLDFMKTHWGREYLAFAQDYGPGIWGLS